MPAGDADALILVAREARDGSGGAEQDRACGGFAEAETFLHRAEAVWI